MDATQTPACGYQQIEHDIHEFIWYRNDYRAVDEWVTSMARIYDTADVTVTVRYLHRDAGTGLPSVNYVMQKVRDLERRYPDRPSTRGALLVGAGIRIMMLNGLITLTNIRGRDVSRFFPVTHRQEALEWLMRDM